MSKQLLCFECDNPALPRQIFCQEHLHMQPEPKMPEYTQGVCEDGAAILKDGQRMTIEEILAALNKKPTHYAVIDEYGDIVTAVKVETYRDAKHLAHLQLKAIAEGAPEAKDWTVKGVTVHEG